VKVLLDENLPHRLRNHLGSHEVFTVRYQGWSGLKNGELLQTAETDGFEVFLTGDQTMSHEQNLTGRQIAIVVLSAIEWHIIRQSLLTIKSAIDAAAPGSHHAIECGVFNRKQPRP
jgi:predicted nuclease of predicted toxin-antitoxin system